MSIRSRVMAFTKPITARRSDGKTDVKSKQTSTHMLGPIKYKEVFVKHEQAPTAPKLKGVCFFCKFKIYFLRKPLFVANLTTSGRVFLTEMVKMHIFEPIPFGSTVRKTEDPMEGSIL